MRTAQRSRPAIGKSGHWPAPYLEHGVAAAARMSDRRGMRAEQQRVDQFGSVRPIAVALNGTRTMIDRWVFEDLFENSVVSGRAPYRQALDRSEITFGDLVELSRKADIPYPLFFAPHAHVRAQIATKTDKLLQGVSKETFALNSRTTVDVKDVELIVKDLIRKQMLLRKHDLDLEDNRIVGLLKRSRGSAAVDAQVLVDALGLQHDTLSQARTKKRALEILIERLEAHQVLVSLSVRGFMPQLIEVKFSGLTIKDKKVPYIFLARGDHGDAQEPEGRQLFTLTLLAVLVARGIFAPVTYDGSSPAVGPGREYDIVGEILMPEQAVRGLALATLEDLQASADRFKVTPSALVVRAQRLRLVSPAVAASHLNALGREFAARPPSRAQQPKPVNGVRTYNGREFSARMLRALDAGRVSPGDFCRVVCANKIKPHQIRDFREALG